MLPYNDLNTTGGCYLYYVNTLKQSYTIKLLFTIDLI